MPKKDDDYFVFYDKHFYGHVYKGGKHVATLMPNGGKLWEMLYEDFKKEKARTNK